MKTTGKNRLAFSLTIAALAGVVLALPVYATNGVTQVLDGGTRSASIADLALAAKTYSHSSQTSTGTMTLTADDSSATGAGWNVTVQSSAFVYSGSNSGTNIAASNFSITTANAPTMVAGAAVDATDGPKVPSSGATGALNVARKTVQANVGFGEGTYDQALDVSLTIPAGSRAGTYTGTMTVTISAAP
jgi:hypothetical protein